MDRSGALMQLEANALQTRIRWTDETLDFKQPTILRKSFIIASLPRSGSQFLSGELWKTGLLGAPCEYLFPAYDMRPMMNRLRATSPVDYIAKLIACRTSPNGLFGMNVHIQHFLPFLRGCPDLLETLAPLTFIYSTRRDKVAQAVSMAKALQTNTWTSQQTKLNPPEPRYIRDLIEKCIEDLNQQEQEWEDWFASNNATPFRLEYEDLARDRPGTIQTIIDLLGAQNDVPASVELPPVERQSDGTNKEWIMRFKAETGQGGEQKTAELATGQPGYNETGTHIGESIAPSSGTGGQYEQYISNPPSGARASAAYVDVIRSRQLFKVIVEQNLSIFENARVLDFPSIDGRWSLAALDAGAACVVGVEPLPRLAARAARTFAELDISQNLYQFINADVYSALASFEPEAFDLIMCVRFLERFDLHRIFQQLRRLRPRFVILDTGIAPGRGPILRFALRMPEIAGSNVVRQHSGTGNLIATPSEDLVAFMCDAYGFHFHRIDWHAVGITDWIGVHEYERGQRGTFLLELNC
jgi:LPS sulfotransferase NodH/SAM-dependent methyltransferase